MPTTLEHGSPMRSESPGGSDACSSTVPEAVRTNKRKSRRPRRIACVLCREAKVRCDVTEDPCSRCRRMGLECKKIVRFSKPNEREKMAELNRHVQQLRSMLEQQSQVSATNLPDSTLAESVRPIFGMPRAASTQPPDDLPAVAHPPQVFLTPNHQLDGNDYQLPDAAFEPQSGEPTRYPIGPVDNNGLTDICSFKESFRLTRTLDSIVLKPDQVDQLFQIYFEHYHAFLPILDPSKRADDYYEASPIIFWSVVAVASRRYGDDITLLTSLSAPVMKMVWTAVTSPPPSISLVQAILIFCTWPFSTSSLWTDSSLYLGGIATVSAMQLGLHQKGGLPAGFTRDATKDRTDASRAILGERARAWAGCNIVTQRLTAITGLPRLTYFNWTLELGCEPENALNLPADLHHQLILHRLCDRMDQAMSSNPSRPASSPDICDHYALLASLEAHLDTFERDYMSVLSKTNQLYLLSARLYLQGYYFFKSSQADRRKEGIMRAYQTASTLISKCVEADATYDILLFASNFLFRMLFNAAAALFKVLQSEYSKDVDFNMGKKLFNMVISCLRRCSVENNDLAGRWAEIMTQLWVTFRMKGSGVSTLRVDGRLGASLIFDCLRLWRLEFDVETTGYAPTTTPVPLEANASTQRREADQGPGFAVDNFDLFLSTPWA